MEQVAVYAGSFDPPTKGHLDVVMRVAPIFDQVILLVADNSRKEPLFLADERVELLKEAVLDLGLSSKVKVDSSNGLVVEYCRSKKARVLIRGLRAMSDFESELQIANVNRRLAPEIETLHIMTDEKFFFISSTLIKEIARHGATLAEWVPENVEKALRERYGHS